MLLFLFLLSLALKGPPVALPSFPPPYQLIMIIIILFKTSHFGNNKQSELMNCNVICDHLSELHSGLNDGMNDVAPCSLQPKQQVGECSRDFKKKTLQQQVGVADGCTLEFNL